MEKLAALTDYRKSKNISQEDMALKLGISRELYNKIERGKSPLSNSTWLSFQELKRSEGDSHVPGSLTAIVNLTEANRQMAESNNKLADGHIRLIALLEKSTADASKQNQPDGPSTIDKVLEVLAVVGAGKKWPTKEAAEQAFRTIVYGSDEAFLAKHRTAE